MEHDPLAALHLGEPIASALPEEITDLCFSLALALGMCRVLTEDAAFAPSRRAEIEP